jgi:CRP/FNR family cyclic AMP-dependent transcriptional regulator
MKVRVRPISAVLASAPRRYDVVMPEEFLAELSVEGALRQYRKRELIFLEGEIADAAFYIQKGKVKLGVTSQSGKKATVAILGTGDFLGEGCIATKHSRRTTSASAISECSILRIERQEIIHMIRQKQAFLDVFVSYLLARNRRIQEDLIDQLFNSTEKRLARTLLLLAGFDKQGTSEMVMPKISQQSLAEMIGTTRPRVNFFMRRFKKMGFIGGGRDLHVKNSLLNVVLEG